MATLKLFRLLLLHFLHPELCGQIFSMICRFTCAENRDAYRKLIRGYDGNIMGMVMEGILLIHKDKKITYTLSDEADKLYEKIIDKLNDQFNLKYMSASQLSSSQPDLNNNEKSELSVRTKGTEIIGRLTCSLWIYCNGNMFLKLRLVSHCYIRFNFHLGECLIFCSIHVCTQREIYQHWDQNKQGVCALCQRNCGHKLQPG